VYAFPAILPLGIGKEAAQDLGIEIAFAAEITVEAARRKAGTGHDLSERNILETVPIK
jgi:hypothetical protein